MAFALTVPRTAPVIGLVVILLIIGGSVGAVYLPSAQIDVYPVTLQKDVQQLITLSTSSGPDFVKFVLPSQMVEKTIDERLEVNRRSGPVHDDFARGQVTFTNEREEEQSLLPHSHLRHEASGVFFLTDAPVTIPPGGEVVVSVTAKEKGSSGNVPAGRFIVEKFPSSLQKKVYAQSSEVFAGGVAVDTAVTGEEIEKAKSDVRKKAEARVQGEMTGVAGGAALAPELITFEVESEHVSTQVGSFADAFSASIRVKGRAFVADQNDLLSLTLLALRAAPTPDQELATYDPDSFRVAIKRIDFDRGQAQVEGTLRGTFAAKISPTVFSADNLAGRSEAEVKEYFKQFSNVSDVSVTFSPFWVQAVPTRPGATTISVHSPEKT